MSPRAVARVVFVGGSWCRPCKAFLPLVQGLCRERGLELEVLSIDGAGGLPRPSLDMKVMSVPTLIAFDASGRELRRSAGGTMSAAALSAWLTNGGL